MSEQGNIENIKIASDVVVGLPRVDFTQSHLYERTIPVFCSIYGVTISTSGRQNWAQLLVAITEMFIEKNNPKIAALYYQPLNNHRTGHPFFMDSKIDDHNCARLSNGKWLDINHSIPRLVDIIGKLCIFCGVKLDDVKIYYMTKSNTKSLGAAPFISTKKLAESFQSDEKDTKSIIYSVLSSHFTNGFRLDSVIDYNRLRRFIEEDCNVFFEKTDDELKNDITALGTLYDGKVFLITDEVKNWLKGDVLSIFEGGLNYVYFETYFEKNYNQLVENCIYSADMLKSVLKELLPYFYFKKLFMYMKEEISLENELIHCFDETVLLNYEQIAKKLQYVPLAVIKQFLGQNGDFIWNSSETYTHISKIEIIEAERQVISNFVQEQVSINGHASAADIPIENINERNYELSETAIHSAVYRICLADNYDKRGKIIVNKGIQLDAFGIMKEYCCSLDKCTLDDLLAFEKELTGEQHRWIPMEAAYATMVRTDENLYIAENHVVFDVAAIDQVIETFCFGKYMPLRAVTTFAAFPYTGQAWTMYLLESYVRRFSNIFRFAVLAANSKNAGAIVRKSCPLKYREILADAVAKSNIQLSEDSMITFLYESGYIGRRSISNASKLIEQAKIIRNRG